MMTYKFSFKVYLLFLLFFLFNKSIWAQLGYNYNDYKKDSGFKYDKPIKDKDILESKKFVHDHLIKRLYEKECSKKDDDESKRKDVCNGVTPSFTGKTGDMAIETIAKMYGVFFSPAMLGDFKVMRDTNHNDKGNSDKAVAQPESKSKLGGAPDEALPDSTEKSVGEKAKSGEKKPEETHDYCALGPTVTETGSTMYFTIQDENEKAKSNSTLAKEGEQGVGQSEKLFQYAKQYEYKQTAGRINSAGWAATTSCYAVQAATLGFTNVSPSYWLRPAASFGITAYWSFKAGFFGLGGGVYGDYINIANLLGSSLRSLKGACNPHTERACYCAQPETRYDPKYCVPQILQAQAKLQAENGPVGVCVDDKLQQDPQCKCLDSNTCFDVKYNKIASPFFGPGIAKSNSLLNNIQKISRGDIQGLSRNQVSLANLRNALSKALSQRKPLANYPSTNSLSDSQKREAQDFLNMGIPEDLANTMAAMPLGDAGRKFLKDYGQNPDQGLAEFLAKQKIGDYDEGTNYQDGQNRIGNHATDTSTVGSAAKKDDKGTEIRNYQKLINAADIPKNNDESIFVRVSKRVHNSFWSVLDRSIFDIRRSEQAKEAIVKPLVTPTPQ